MATNIKKRPDLTEIAVGMVQDKFSSYPSNGLTPLKLASIFKEADMGQVLRQMELFEEMEEKDPHMFSQLQTRKNAVTGLDYELIPFSEEARDKQICEFVKQELESLENFEDVTMDLLDAIGKGIAVSEILWDINSGHTLITDIKHRPQKSFFWDAEDNFKLYTLAQPSGILVPENKFIVHRYKGRSGHASRAGVLRVVAWMYLFKNYDIKDWVSFCEIFGMPLRIGKYAAGASEDDKTALMNALIQIGSDAAGIFPEGASIEFKEAGKTSSTDVYERLARYCDEQISKAILGQTLTSDSGGGSFAQSKTHNEVRHDLTIADCKALAATLRRDLIRPLVMFNFGEDRRIPYIRYDCEAAADLKETADIYKTLVCDVGLPIAKSHMYKKFSIPKPEDGEELITPSKPLPFKSLSASEPIMLKQTTPDNSQQRVDTLVTNAVKQSSAVFQKLFAPVLKLLDGADSLDAVKAALDDPKAVAQLASQMNVADLEELLQRAMMLAHLESSVEHG